MKKLFLMIMLLLFATGNTWAQDPNNHWQLGNTDINFSTNPPTTNNSGVATQYSNASISDDNGNLLFYTDGKTVWNKNHQLIKIIDPTNYTYSGIFQQKVIIVPQQNSNRFYIFRTNPSSYLSVGTAANYRFHRYAYSIVDFSNNLLGDVVDFSGTNNLGVYSQDFVGGDGNIEGPGANGPLTSVKTSTNDAYWVIIQLKGGSGDKIYSFKLDSLGLDLNPVISDFNSIFSSQYDPDLNFKFSPNNNKLGVLEGNGYNSDSVFYTYDFNSLTGNFSNKITHSNTQPFFRAFGFEFSSDSQKVYFTNNDLIVKDLSNSSSLGRIITALPTIPSSDPGAPIHPNGHLQRDKNGEILLIMSNLSAVKKVDNQNSFLTSSLSGNYCLLNSNFVTPHSLPQLIPIFTPSYPTTLIISTNVIAGLDKKQASVSIEANNIINSGASAIYHAPLVKLKPSFNAKAGSAVYIYPVGCSNSFSARLLRTNVANNDLQYSKTVTVKNTEIINISPNPNDGTFNISLKDVSEGTIEVSDLYGFNIYNSDFKNQTDFEMNMQDRPKGIYIVKVFSREQVFTSKIIKN